MERKWLTTDSMTWEDLSTFQEAFDADIFQGNSHVYVIGPDGEQLYGHQCEGGHPVRVIQVLEGDFRHAHDTVDGGADPGGGH